MDIEKATGALVSIFNSKSFNRRWLYTIAIIVSIMAYRYAVTPFPDRDLFGQVGRWLFNNGYDLYSGQAGGFYFTIGKTLDDSTKGKPGIKITNRPSEGGVDNAIKVASSRSAFGLVQEDSIPEGDFIRNEIKFITPLYLEQVHILYRKSSYEQYVENSDLATVKVSLDDNSVKDFFAQAVISSGSPHSGSSIVASQILNTLGVAPRQDRQMSSSDAVLKLMNNGNDPKEQLDAVFWITGGPNKLIAEALKDGEGNREGEGESEIRIMGIDPTIAQLINERYKSKLRPATFKDVYNKGKGVPTIGVYSFLISSNDVPSFAIMDMIRVLEKGKPRMKSAMNHSYGTFQLDQFNFKEYYERNYHGFMLDLVKNIFIFLISITATTTGVMIFLVWTTSGFRQVTYFRRLLHLYKEYTPNNAELEEKKPPFLKPEIYENQIPVVSRLAKGTRELLLWGRAVRADHDKGIITTGHYNHLSRDFDKLREIFQKSLSRRLYEVIHSDGVQNLIDGNDIRHYYTAGYIRRDDYQYLMRALPEPEAQGA